jgi:hypothetical protein
MVPIFMKNPFTSSQILDKNKKIAVSKRTSLFCLADSGEAKKSFYSLEALMCKIDAGILNWYGIKFPEKKTTKANILFLYKLESDSAFEVVVPNISIDRVPHQFLNKNLIFLFFYSNPSCMRGYDMQQNNTQDK